ncbi:MAG: DmsE family decaheme c-type cytochrome [Xanthomonadales bacterium]|nr:DmsE family decaheme c-type cytochrome [Xanthomonadales bacterium]
MRLSDHSALGRWAVLAALLVSLDTKSQELSKLGADSCLPCHGQGMPLDATPIFQTRHASTTNPAAPFSGHQCEACHGPGAEHIHAQQRGLEGLPPVVYGTDSPTPTAEQNAVCLGCHQSGSRMAWHDSAHASSDVPCAACHAIHMERDPVFDPLAQQQACFDCHPRRRSDIHKATAHPLRFGSMSCSDCHDPHNGDHERLLVEATINETCYRCHAEKQGPYLWEHAPAAEDCGLCHQPHGSNHPALLVRRPPLLCQTCHAAEGHPSLALTGDSLESVAENRFLLGRACLNCHSQVHGSNHPSGATLHR